MSLVQSDTATSLQSQNFIHIKFLTMSSYAEITTNQNTCYATHGHLLGLEEHLLSM